MKHILTFISIFVMMLFCLFIYHYIFSKKIAYIDIQKTFNEFQMKKEMELKYKKLFSRKKKIIDSMSIELQNIAYYYRQDSIQSKTNRKNYYLQLLQYKKNQLYQKQKQIELENENQIKEFDEQIISRINQYVLEYGKKNHYDIILGGSGNGNIMYAKEAINITDDIIKYINEKYQGTK